MSCPPLAHEAQKNLARFAFNDDQNDFPIPAHNATTKFDSHYPRCTAVAEQHHRRLKAFLQDYVHVINNIRSSNTFSTLSEKLFLEHSSTLFDVLEEKLKARSWGEARIAPREEFSELQNSDREALASLSKDSFASVAGAVFVELERRYPHFRQQELSRPILSPKLNVALQDSKRPATAQSFELARRAVRPSPPSPLSIKFMRSISPIPRVGSIPCQRSPQLSSRSPRASYIFPVTPSSLLPEIRDLTSQITSLSTFPISVGATSSLHRALYRNSMTVGLKIFRHSVGWNTMPTSVQRREIILWQRLHHPHVLPFLGVCQTELGLALVSPLQRNGNAVQYLRNKSMRQKLEILKQVALALIHFHFEHHPCLVHGDIKGENILISESGDALLADFGLSRLTEPVPWLDPSSPSMKDKGTWPFMAPELFALDATGRLEDRPAKTRETDVYAFGSLILQIISGGSPWQQFPNQYQGLLYIGLGGKLSRPTNFPVELWRLAEWCWERDPNRRPNMMAILSLLSDLTT